MGNGHSHINHLLTTLTTVSQMLILLLAAAFYPDTHKNITDFQLQERNHEIMFWATKF